MMSRHDQFHMEQKNNSMFLFFRLYFTYKTILMTITTFPYTHNMHNIDFFYLFIQWNKTELSNQRPFGYTAEKNRQCRQ